MSADKLFEKYVKPMKLPPRLAGGIKQAMEAVLAGGGDKAAAKAAIGPYLTERGRDPATGELTGDKPKKPAAKPKEATEEKPKKKEKAAKEEPKAEAPKPKKKVKGDGDGADPAKDKLVEAGAKKALKGNDEAGVPAGNIDLRTLDRATMKGMAKDLLGKYKKSWTDDELRAKLAPKLVGMDNDAKKALKEADPAKIEALSDCVGVLLDLSAAICITCPAQADCRKLFEEHRANGFQVFKDLAPGTVSADALTKKPDAVGTVYNATSKIQIVDKGKIANLPKVKVDGSDVDNSEHKEFLLALRKQKDKTLPLADLRTLVLEHYDADDSDKDAHKLTMWFARFANSHGMLKFV